MICENKFVNERVERSLEPLSVCVCDDEITNYNRVASNCIWMGRRKGGEEGVSYSSLL